MKRGKAHGPSASTKVIIEYINMDGHEYPSILSDVRVPIQLNIRGPLVKASRFETTRPSPLWFGFESNER